MAVTSLWAVRGSPRDILSYVMNPEKTANPDFALCKVLNYAENEAKTEKKYYVTGINCTPDFACERMTATKEHYGKTGGIVCYHGYQSFLPGEVTPEQCHAIGVETARQMWGDRFEVIVTTHLIGSSALHNHFVVNSVSFSDGRKYRCQKGTHLELRKVSDRICRDNNLSVIENPLPKKQPRGEWMAERDGCVTHSSILRKDVDRAVRNSKSFTEFIYALENYGYVVTRDSSYSHPSLIIDRWDKPLRLDYLGERYTTDAIEERIRTTPHSHVIYDPPLPKKRPMSELERIYSKDTVSLLELMFIILFTLLGYDLSNPKMHQPDYTSEYRALSPALRMECIHLEHYTREVRLMESNDLHTEEDVQQFHEEREMELAVLLFERNQLDNARRRMTDPEEKERNSRERHEITQRMIKVRRERNLAGDILRDCEKLKELLRIEWETEKRLIPEREAETVKVRTKSKGYER